VKLKRSWQTVAIVGYSGGVAGVGTRQEPRAAGGVTLLQMRVDKWGSTLGRKVNSNGRHLEFGPAFLMCSEIECRWRRLGESQ